MGRGWGGVRYQGLDLIPPSPRADWADTWFLMDEMMFVALRQSQLEGTGPPHFSDPAFLTMLGILSGAL